MDATKLGIELTAQEQREVLSAYIYRMTHESVRAHRAAAVQMYKGGFRMPLISDAQWLATTRFAVTKSGALSNRETHCEHDHSVRGEAFPTVEAARAAAGF